MDAGEESCGLNTLEVSQRTGLSLRQLQWLDERKLLSADRVNGNREYTEKEIRLAGIIAELRNAGVSLQRIRKLLATLNRHVHSHPPAYILVHGDKISFAESPSIVIALLKRMQRQCRCAGVVIELGTR